MEAVAIARQAVGDDRVERIEALLRPRSVVVIGASSQRRTLGNQVLANFERWPFPGPVHVVHPTARVIGGFPTVPRVRDLPPGIDVAVVCLPAAAAADVLVELDAVGCRAAILVAAGFDADDERRLKDAMETVSVAVCGPNNMGVINVADSIALYTARFREPLPVGRMALVAQSGSGAIALVNTPGLAFSRVITSGNEFGLGAPDYLRWLARDPETTVAGLVLESIRDGNEFAAGARLFLEAGKHLVVLEVGRSPSGLAAAQAHTGALISTGDAYEAFFRRLHIPQVKDYDELAATLTCLATPGLSLPRGARLGVVAISGGEGAVACDVAADMGVPLAIFTEPTRAALSAVLPGSRADNPIDLGASVGRGDEDQERAVRLVLEDPGVDAVLIIQDAQHSLPIHDAHDYVKYLSLVRRAVAGASKPVVVASTTSTDIHPRLEQVLQGSSVPMVRGIREAIAALANLAVAGTASACSGRPRQAQLTGTRDREGLGSQRIGCGRAGPLAPGEAARLLSAYRIPLVSRAIVQNPAEAVAAAAHIGYPMVVKVVSAQVPHRSDVGGVITGVVGDDALIRALGTIRDRVARARPDVAIEGYELQPLIENAIEAMVGFKTEAALGATVTVGWGGVLVELLGQRAIELAPVDRAQAVRMIRATALGPLLDGYRGLVPPTPVEGLAQVIEDLSRLAAEWAGPVAAVDLNPVMVRHGSGEAIVVDALVIAAGSP